MSKRKTKPKTAPGKNWKQKGTEDLISSLCDGLEPVCCLHHPLRRALTYIIGALLYIGLIVYWLGFRPDMGAMLSERAFLFETLLTTSIFLTAAVATAWMCVPDMRGQNWLATVPTTLFGVFMLWIGLEAFTGELAAPHNHMPHCTMDCILVAGIPAAAIVFLSMKGATTRPVLTAFMGMLAMGALSHTVLRFTCMNDNLTHVGLYHLLPFIVGGAILGAIAQRIYRRW